MGSEMDAWLERVSQRVGASGGAPAEGTSEGAADPVAVAALSQQIAGLVRSGEALLREGFSELDGMTSDLEEAAEAAEEAETGDAQETEVELVPHVAEAPEVSGADAANADARDVAALAASLSRLAADGQNLVRDVFGELERMDVELRAASEMSERYAQQNDEGEER